jgi:hypothetical protein
MILWEETVYNTEGYRCGEPCNHKVDGEPKAPVKIKKPYFETDDKVYGTKFVYCSQHMRIHETGWCLVSVVDKIPLLSETAEEASQEWELKKQWLPREKA